MTGDYEHPASGRIYRQGDPAHRFARLAAALRRQCDEFARHYDQRMADRDYLDQQRTWPSDPDRIARFMRETIAALDQAYTDVVYDEQAPEFGLGKRDEEWQRKYGDVRGAE